MRRLGVGRENFLDVSGVTDADTESGDNLSYMYVNLGKPRLAEVSFRVEVERECSCV